MNILQKIFAPKETVNDETVYVTALYVNTGEFVTSETLLLEIETSKALLGIQAECDGYVELCCRQGDEIRIGEPLLLITDGVEEERADPEGDSPADAELPPGIAIAPLFSRRALELIELHGVATSRFDQHDFVLARDVEEILGVGAAKELINSDPVVIPPRPEPEVDNGLVDVIPLSRTKKTEIRYLSDINSSGLTSMVAISIEADALFRVLARGSSYFSESLLPLLTYETSRLLKKYRELNAFFVDNSIAFHKAVNVGVAVDMEKGLKVLTLYQADTTPLKELDRTLFDLIDRYCENRLEPADTSGSTFTISDLAAYGVDFFLPLVNSRQSAILGVSAMDLKLKRVCLTLSFDHRVTDGKTVGLFLAELKGRMESYQAAGGEEGGERCGVCLKSLAEDARLSGFGLVQRLNHRGDVDYICAVCLRGGA